MWTNPNDMPTLRTCVWVVIITALIVLIGVALL
jgi:hypothetical protein